MLLLGVPRLPAGHQDRMNGLVPQHRSPHLSREKALGAGCWPSFSVRLFPGSDPHAALGELPRMPVHRPPLGPLQHFLTQPSRALQGTSVHPVQRRGRQTVLHISLRGYIHTNTGWSAGRRDPTPAAGGSPASTSPATTAPSSAPKAPSGRCPSGGQLVRADSLHFRLPPLPSVGGPHPLAFPGACAQPCVGEGRLDLENPAPAQQAIGGGLGLGPAPTTPFASWRRPGERRLPG